MAMADDGAPRRSSGGLSALSHQLMRKFSGGGGERSRSSAPADKNLAPADKNLVFSPLSIYSALSLAAAGAKGRTLGELLDVLGAKSRDSLAEDVRRMVDRALPADAGAQKHKGLAETVRSMVKPDGDRRVEHACGVWHDAARTIKPTYRDVAAASCRAVARAVDFLNEPEEARKEINSWVASATNKLISSILPPGSVDESTGLVVATAIYFKGMWRTPFDASMTKEGKFHRMDGTTVDAQFMRSREDQYIATYSGFKVLKMPYAAADDDDTFVERHRQLAVDDDPFVERRPRWYDPFVPRALLTPTGGPRYSMLVLLPDARDGLPALEDKMLASGNAFLERHTPEVDVEVGDFRVPRFKLSFYTEVKPVLQELGVRAVFDEQAAELPDVLEQVANKGGQPLFVGDVYHKAVIEVNEQGTEAAASTAMTMLVGCAAPEWRPKPVDFVADHPFAFFVVEDRSGAILFAGHVHDPTET